MKDGLLLGVTRFVSFRFLYFYYMFRFDAERGAVGQSERRRERREGGVGGSFCSGGFF